MKEKLTSSNKEISQLKEALNKVKKELERKEKNAENSRIQLVEENTKLLQGLRIKEKELARIEVKTESNLENNKESNAKF
jgi:hypothetical protein